MLLHSCFVGLWFKPWFLTQFIGSVLKPLNERSLDGEVGCKELEADGWCAGRC